MVLPGCEAYGKPGGEIVTNRGVKLLKHVASYVSSLVVYIPPVVRECMWELTCLLTEDDYSKCAWYVVRCVSKHVVGIASCLYDLGGDVAINIAYHGEYIWDYDYGQILWDVLTCAGVDKILKDLGLDIIKERLNTKW